MVEVVKGLRDLEKKLMKLGPAAGGKALRSAASFSMTPTLKEARARAPENDRDYLKKTYKGRYVSSGFLKRSIRRRSWLSRSKSFVKVRIGVLPEAYYGVTFVERGTSKMPKQPWLEPAFRSTRQTVTARFRRKLKERIMKVAKK